MGVISKYTGITIPCAVTTEPCDNLTCVELNRVHVCVPVHVLAFRLTATVRTCREQRWTRNHTDPVSVSATCAHRRACTDRRIDKDVANAKFTQANLVRGVAERYLSFGVSSETIPKLYSNGGFMSSLFTSTTQS